jgi:assimilatory nitrate reductase catalytic subunit
MHWGEEFVTRGINVLMPRAFCPTSRQPELKHSAVKVLKAELPWRLVALAWSDDAAALRERLRPLMGAFDFATCVPFGRERGGVLFRAAAYEAASDAWLEAFEATLGLGPRAPDLLRYADRRRRQRRTMRVVRDAGQLRLDAFVLAGDVDAQVWLRPLLEERADVTRHGRLLLAPGARPPLDAAPARGRQVCNCLDVAEPAIAAELRACSGSSDQRLAHVQRMLQCGTQCGSCLPELRRLVRQHAALAS